MRHVVFCVTLFIAVLGGKPAEASKIFNFEAITNNNAGNPEIGEAQLQAEAIDEGPGQIRFRFTNSGPDPATIAEIYFDDDGNVLLGISLIDDSLATVDFSPGANPPNLPSRNSIVPAFAVDFAAQADPSPAKNGVNPGEFVAVVFDLELGQTFDSVVADLRSRQLRFGLHVISIGDTAGSEAFVATFEPASVVLALIAFVALCVVAWRRKTRFQGHDIVFGISSFSVQAVLTQQEK